jgi:hypothetical protein
MLGRRMKALSHSPGLLLQSGQTGGNMKRSEENSKQKQIPKEEISLARLLLRCVT